MTSEAGSAVSQCVSCTDCCMCRCSRAALHRRTEPNGSDKHTDATASGLATQRHSDTATQSDAEPHNTERQHGSCCCTGQQLVTSQRERAMTVTQCEQCVEPIRTGSA